MYTYINIHNVVCSVHVHVYYVCVGHVHYNRGKKQEGEREREREREKEREGKSTFTKRSGRGAPFHTPPSYLKSVGDIKLDEYSEPHLAMGS